MPTYFEIVKAALDDAYGEFPGDKNAVDAAIKTALTQLSDRYKDVLRYLTSPPAVAAMKASGMEVP